MRSPDGQIKINYWKPSNEKENFACQVIVDGDIDLSIVAAGTIAMMDFLLSRSDFGIEKGLEVLKEQYFGTILNQRKLNKE